MKMKKPSLKKIFCLQSGCSLSKCLISVCFLFRFFLNKGQRAFLWNCHVCLLPSGNLLGILWGLCCDSVSGFSPGDRLGLPQLCIFDIICRF